MKKVNEKNKTPENKDIDENVDPLENETARPIPMSQKVRFVQKMIKKYVPNRVSLVDELIQARREDAGQTGGTNQGLSKKNPPGVADCHNGSQK